MKFCRIVIDNGACFLWAFLILLLPLRWMAAFFLAVMIHESFHYAALAWFRKEVRELHIGVGGIRMEVENLSYMEELFCAAAGPLGGFLLMSFSRYYPELSICGMLQSVFNLLPVYPLDGGRILRSGISLIFPRHAESICRVVEIIFLIIALIFFFSHRMSFLCLGMGIFLIVKILHGKIPCKPLFLRVQ